MRRVSTNVPFSTPSMPNVFLIGNGDGNSSRDDVSCSGKLAPLHSRAGFEEIQARRSSVTMPPIFTPRRRSVSSRSAVSTSSLEDFPRPPENSPRTENQSGGPKFILNIISETSDLSGGRATKKQTKRKGQKRKDKLPLLQQDSKKTSTIKKKLNRKSTDVTIRLNDEVLDTEGAKTAEAAKEGATESKISKEQGDGDEEDMYCKYGLDLRKDYGWEISRAFTFSYFPKLAEQPQKKTKKPKKPGLTAIKKPKTDVVTDLTVNEI
ncbi:uncharacterized protein LOC116616316 [Nematostella vectensis]|uniref:uncharacterized protein LOC116616316 n=1 Tax=Nematostella vectensis TaxID=45351 RepID=UPI00207765C3|nr:uncharacterized protein LOC116616316 [Nematostella vectensis]